MYELSESKSPGEDVGVFITLPEEIAKQFPSLAPKDTSDPHVTVLIAGYLRKPGDKDKFVKCVTKRAKLDLPTKLTAKLGQLDYFVSVEKNTTVPHVTVSFSSDLARFKYNLTQDLKFEGIELQDKFTQVYRPHVTLGYYEGIYDVRYDKKIPQGTWEVGHLEIWGYTKLIQVPIGSTHSVKFI